MKRWGLVAAMTVAVLAASCRDPLGPERDALADARARWAAAEVASYRFDYLALCYCGLVPVRITVSEGAVTTVEVLEPERVPGWNGPEGVTVEMLFDRIEEGLALDPVEASVTYHPVLGYPTAASFDPEENVADEEWGFTVTAFERLD